MTYPLHQEEPVHLVCRFSSEYITLDDAASFLNFLREAYKTAAIHHGAIDRNSTVPYQYIPCVNIEHGSIKVKIKLLNRNPYFTGATSSLLASIVWAMATHAWSNKTLETNVPVRDTSYRIEIDDSINNLVKEMNRYDKPYEIEIECKDDRELRGLKVKIKSD